MNKQAWIYSPRTDLAFIIGPPFVVTALLLLLQGQAARLGAMPPWLWLLLIVGVDVTHVYSTLFRTYFDREEMRQRQTIYWLAPFVAWVGGCLLYSFGAEVFWRVLAYFAVFHFVRQQYGFMMIYGRRDPPQYKWLDKLVIYAATLYPLIYWHCHERHFDWFIEGDFVRIESEWVSTLAGLLYGAILAGYCFKEWKSWRAMRNFNWPRNLMLLGTALSWGVGIVLLDNDIAFSAINVVSHGVPYIALIWIYGRNQGEMQGENSSYFFHWVATVFQRRRVMAYLGVLFLLAYVEEIFWDGLVWREHGAVLLFAEALREVQTEQTLAWLVPLLAMPQVTHYILDAYIWRLKEADTNWKDILFWQTR